MSKFVVFYDTEFTSWEGAMASDWGEEWQYRELVQIGAMRFDVENFVEIDRFDIFIQPVKNPILSDYFSKLTHITNAQLKEHGQSFEAAYQKFVAYIGQDPIYSYGGDHLIVQENCTLYGFEQWAKEFKGLDIRPWFGQQGIDINTVNSGALAKTLGVDLDMHEHNALDDVKSIWAAFEFLVKNGAANPLI